MRESRDRARRVAQIRAEGYTTTNAVHAVYGPKDEREHSYDNDRLLLADAYLALTDPTPLTVEVLVEMGGVKNGEFIIEFAGFDVFHGGEPETWLWDKPFSGESLMLPPRTAGELRQLLQRLEK